MIPTKRFRAVLIGSRFYHMVKGQWMPARKLSDSTAQHLTVLTDKPIGDLFRCEPNLLVKFHYLTRN